MIIIYEVRMIYFLKLFGSRREICHKSHNPSLCKIFWARVKFKLIGINLCEKMVSRRYLVWVRQTNLGFTSSALDDGDDDHRWFRPFFFRNCLHVKIKPWLHILGIWSRTNWLGIESSPLLRLTLTWHT